MDRQTRERFVEACLRRRDWEALAREKFPPGLLLRRLVHLLQNPDELLAWRAVEALGRSAARLGPSEPLVAETLRSLFWMMNDESGNLCRKAPEAVGAILAFSPGYLPAFGPLLPPYLREEPFEAGTLWALDLLLTKSGRDLAPDPDDLEDSLRSPDPRRRGLAMRFVRRRGGAVHGRPARFFDYDLDRGTLFEAEEPPF